MNTRIGDSSVIVLKKKKRKKTEREEGKKKSINGEFHGWKLKIMNVYARIKMCIATCIRASGRPIFPANLSLAKTSG